MLCNIFQCSSPSLLSLVDWRTVTERVRKRGNYKDRISKKYEYYQTYENGIRAGDSFAKTVVTFKLKSDEKENIMLVHSPLKS